MIEAVYYVYDCELEFDDSYVGRDEAEERAKYLAEGNGYPYGVMLKVAVGGTSMPELRAVTVYDESGNEVFRTHSYDPELVSAT